MRELQHGELLLRNRAFLCAPAMRTWMDPPGNNFHPSLPLGQPVAAAGVAEVIASARKGIPTGARVAVRTSWQDFHYFEPQQDVVIVPEDTSDVEALGIYGLNAKTAYFGLLKVGAPKAGETLVVSGAAGSTGSVASQIGKILRCRVIGIAGGPDKCSWLTQTCGLDAAVDYRKGGVSEALAELAPAGIDIFFDNVGGDMLQAAVDNMARFGRIVLCGQIATYTDARPGRGPGNIMRVIYGSVRMQGFLQHDYASEADQAIAQIRLWVEGGLIVHREDVRDGFAQIPETFAALFESTNNGTLIARITQ